MRKRSKFNFINIAILTVFAILGSVSDIFAQSTYSLSNLSTAISSQQAAVKNVVAAVCGIIFVAGIVHVVIAFVNHSQNLKTIVMSYVGAFIAFAALWAFL